MMNTIQIRLYDLFRKELNLSDEKAAAFVQAVEEVANKEAQENSKGVSTKEDILKLELKLEQTKSELRTELYRAVFWTGLVQLFAILGGVMVIIKTMVGK